MNFNLHLFGGLCTRFCGSAGRLVWNCINVDGFASDLTLFCRLTFSVFKALNFLESPNFQDICAAHMVYIQKKQANHTFTITFSRNNNYLNVPGTKSYVQHKDFCFYWVCVI